MADYILEMENITKDFSGVKALNNVNLKVKRGEIHALCGENGAGKSTLMKVLSGVYPNGNYSGRILFNGEECHFKDIKDSEAKGIVIIHQELALIPYLSIAENIFLGNEISKYGVVDFDMTMKKAQGLMEVVGLNENPATMIMDIGVGKQQLVEIAKAISKEVKILILDEPTAALNEDDSENLLELLLEFKRQGMTCIIISHKLNEIMKVADQITILRDGKTINTLDKEADKVTENGIIKGMVGRDLDNRYPDYTPDIKEKYFEVSNWNVYHPEDPDRKVINNANFYIRKGEIVGIAGLMGAGRTELAMSIFGKSYGNKISGSVKKDGKEIKINNVSQAIESGLAYVTEDRKGNGLVLIQDINQNISMASLDRISKSTIIDENKEIENSEYYKKKMRIKSNSIFQTVGSLSGGNQQKVVLAKWMLSQPDVLFLDEPTRGIDVGAKYEIYAIIQEMAKAGKAICIISSELPEILGMCDRIYTMNEGSITSEMLKQDATQEKLMEHMTSKVGA
ncbi:multiple monosaccharide ABC transporter ATP-binding protein [Enterococcus asini]|uniref:multiple monosaccharide ABC transporter ATP-binding protein n=1 Tax=Enterococcus asini TaxID=57732 RepID=UPI0026DD00CA|nr:multiple monosaccharide ABC transporter ATP-binding protein [Enterococcus asini]